MTEPGLQLGAQASLNLDRSMNLDFLDMELPDLQEFIPVDSFFGEYVSGLELGAQEGQQLAEQNMFTTDQGMSDRAGAPGMSNGLATDSMTLNNRQLSPSQNGSNSSHEGAVTALGSMFPANGMPTPSPAQPMAVERPAGYANGAPLMPPTITTGETPMIPTPGATADSSEMPSIPAPGKRGRPRGSGRGGSRVLATRSDSGGSAEGSLLHQTERGYGGEKTKRNPKQQLQNKQAQQRYRERRKQRFTELEGALDQLNDQVQGERAENAALSSQNAALQGKASQLEALLAAKEAELAALRQQLQYSSSGLAPDAGLDDPEGSASGMEGQLSGQRSEAEAMAHNNSFAAHVASVRAFIEEHQLREVSPLGEGVDPLQVDRMKELVATGWGNVQRAVQAGGVKVLELMTRDAENMSQMTCEVKKARWVRILAALRLAPHQQEALLLLRQQHLKKLHDVYEARQALNMQAMGLMLPHPSKSDTEGTLGGRNPTLEGKMACMSIAGYSACAKSNVALDAVLDKIKENLRLEQKTVMQMHFLVMFRVLSPIQAGLFLVEAYPLCPDALALSNICSQALGRGGEGCPRAAEILAQQNRQEAAATMATTKEAVATTKSAASEQPSLERMDSPEDPASGDSHCSEVYTPS